MFIFNYLEKFPSACQYFVLLSAVVGVLFAVRRRRIRMCHPIPNAFAWPISHTSLDRPVAQRVVQRDP
jgi:hypothetical protein